MIVVDGKDKGFVNLDNVISVEVISKDNINRLRFTEQGSAIEFEYDDSEKVNADFDSMIHGWEAGQRVFLCSN